MRSGRVSSPHDHSQAQNRIKSQAQGRITAPNKLSISICQNFSPSASRFQLRNCWSHRFWTAVVCSFFFKLYLLQFFRLPAETGVYLCYIPPARREILFRNLRTKKTLIAQKNTIWIENESQRHKMNRKSVVRELTRGTRNSNENSRVFLDIGF